MTDDVLSFSLSRFPSHISKTTSIHTSRTPLGRCTHTQLCCNQMRSLFITLFITTVVSITATCPHDYGSTRVTVRAVDLSPDSHPRSEGILWTGTVSNLL